MAETGTAIGITITTITLPFSSVALVSHSLASDTPSVTLMDTDTAIPTVATPTLTTGVAITVAASTTTADITATVITVAAIMEHAVILVPVTVAIPMVPATATNQAWRVCSNNSLALVTIEAPSMELWGLALATPCVPTSTIMAPGPMG